VVISALGSPGGGLLGTIIEGSGLHGLKISDILASLLLLILAAQEVEI
jgi:hypothetical protein